MSRILVFYLAILASAQPAAAETIRAASPCLPAELAPDPSIEAPDLNGRPDLPPLVIQIRRLIPTGSEWFLDATLGVLVLGPEDANDPAVALSAGPDCE
ncbi:MAG: hypothetical protein U1F24_16805 [Alphaproteobacteria bacterium]|jgi:hypothetical protein